MNTYIVLLRGVNVAGKNRLPMKDLVLLLTEYGFEKVKTYIQSGNVLLQAKKVTAAELENLIHTTFGFKTKIIVLGKAEFSAAIKSNPFHSAEGKSVHFYFCSQAPQLNAEKLQKYLATSEEYKLKNNVFYLYAPEGIGRSKLVANLESCLGVSVTGRNLNTIRKLNKLLEKT